LLPNRAELIPKPIDTTQPPPAHLQTRARRARHRLLRLARLALAAALAAIAEALAHSERERGVVVVVLGVLCVVGDNERFDYPPSTVSPSSRGFGRPAMLVKHTQNPFSRILSHFCNTKRRCILISTFAKLVLENITLGEVYNFGRRQGVLRIELVCPMTALLCQKMRILVFWVQNRDSQFQIEIQVRISESTQIELRFLHRLFHPPVKLRYKSGSTAVKMI
jgi:hypothetical protein